MSILKSMLRIGGFITLPFNLWVTAGLLLLAEIVGIMEEKYE